jgi:hypothetical protein
VSAATLRRPAATLWRALRCAYLRWRIEHAQDDVLAAEVHILHAQRQRDAYRFAVQELRCQLAMAESEAA